MPDFIRIVLTAVTCLLPLVVAVCSVRHLIACSESSDVDFDTMEVKHTIYGMMYVLGWVLLLGSAVVVANGTWEELSPMGFSSTTPEAQLALFIPGFALTITLLGSLAVVCWGVQEVKHIAKERYGEV